MGAALDTVGAEDDRRALAHTVSALQLADTVIAVFLLFFAMRRFPLIYIETVVVFAHIFLLNHSLEVFVKSTYSLRAGCRGQMRASAPASSV